MDKKKQIDEFMELAELAQVIDEFCKIALGAVFGDNIIMSFADAIYNAGYRKQSEGKWKLGEGGYIYFGSCCGYAVLAREEEDWNFCPNCGAKMKGGE